MTYSNGFDVDLVLPALTARIGWQQPTKTGSPSLSGTVTNSKSGRYYNDGSFHALCTIDNLKSAQEDSQISDNAFSTFLINLESAIILRGLNQVFQAPELKEQSLLYTRAGFNDIAIVNSTNFMGYMIEIANDKGTSVKITKADLYFNANVTFNLYLYEDGVKSPIKTILVSATAYQRDTIEFDGSGANNPEIVLNFKRGKRYYFGYLQSELGAAQAIQEQVETWATTFCFRATPIKATYDATFGFNHNNKQYTFLPAGLNLEIISFADHTENILRQPYLFDNLTGMQMASYVLELINNSTRANGTQRTAQQQSTQIYMENNQAFPTKEVPVTAGLKSRILEEVQKIRNTFFPRPSVATYNQIADSSYNGTDAAWIKQVIKQHTNPPQS